MEKKFKGCAELQTFFLFLGFIFIQTGLQGSEGTGQQVFFFNEKLRKSPMYSAKRSEKHPLSFTKHRNCWISCLSLKGRAFFQYLW